MAQFEVNTGSLNEEAAALNRLKAQLQQEIMGMRSISARYLNMWEGESKQQFVASVNQNMNLLNAFLNLIGKFASTLNQGASSYESGENKAKGIVSRKGQ